VWFVLPDGEQMAQRQLILVTKVLQNLANDTLPGAKEVLNHQRSLRPA